MARTDMITCFLHVRMTSVTSRQRITLNTPRHGDHVCQNETAAESIAFCLKKNQYLNNNCLLYYSM